MKLPTLTTHAPPRAQPPPQDAEAIAGLGPRWRLLAACRKGIACPRCGPGMCLGRNICIDRLWAFAALRRRDKRPLCEEDVATVHKGLQTGDARALKAAIRYGLVRLERVPGNDAEVQWVDAV